MKKILLGVFALSLIASSSVLAQVPCDPLMYFNSGGQDLVHTMNLPTVWWGVKMTPEPYLATVDSAYICFGIEKNTAITIYDSLEVRILLDTLPRIDVLDYYKSAIPAGFGGSIPDNYWVVELDFDQTMAQIPVGRNFWLTWRLKGPSGDVGRTIMKLDAINKERSIVLNNNGSYQTVTQYLTTASFRDSVDLWAEAHVCYINGKPVELVSFTAAYRDGAGVLSWRTETETNNYGFEIERLAERSENGAFSLWQKIGFVPGAGSSAHPRTYEFVDDNPRLVMNGQGVVRYRLRQVDIDGTTTASPVAELRIPFATDGLVLEQNYPNPFTRAAGFTSIRFTTQETRVLTLALFDAMGRHVRTLAEDAFPAGTNDMRIDAAGLTAGVYFLVLSDGDVRVARRISLLD
ncbi:MAG: T9SS type A sorting domain-containing protein [Ignavibacteriae bacterium]|nr:T9SS type A sorting domain-containing protein [Ignavibacteriota bacterium]